MGKNNNKIELSEEEAVKVISVDRIIVSPDRIKCHFGEEKDIKKFEIKNKNS